MAPLCQRGKKKRKAYQQGSEDGEESPETEDDAVADALIENWLASEEATLPHALAVARQRVVLLAEPQRGARGGSHERSLLCNLPSLLKQAGN